MSANDYVVDQNRTIVAGTLVPDASPAHPPPPPLTPLPLQLMAPPTNGVNGTLGQPGQEAVDNSTNPASVWQNIGTYDNPLWIAKLVGNIAGQG